ncbi:MAG: RNB domain-containing ribonuclease, partial [Bdellovibrionota bacterium]
MPKKGRFRNENKKKNSFEFRDRTGKTHGARSGPKSHSRPKGATGARAGGPALIQLKGTIDKNRKGFAFIGFASRDYEDAFVPPHEAERLFHGDRVEVWLGRKGEVVKLKVLEHRFRELVGRFTPHPMGSVRGGWVVYERKRAREEVFVEKPPVGIDPNSWVRAKLHFHEKGQFHVTAEILENYGQNLPPSADVGMIANEFNLVEEHTEAAEAEAAKLGKELHKKDFEHRTDLRTVPFITIDGETARDFDDAVFVEKKERSFRLWVAIADVSHYVRPGEALDKDAQSRGTSVYFPERAFHMLPRALSENLCSLKPLVPRLALVSRIDIDSSGKFLETEIIEAVIESKRRATYNEIEKEWRANQNDKSWQFTPHFELFQILKNKRSYRGSIDFDLPEAEVVVKPTGEVVSLKQRSRLDAHRLIEEFMIAANESVTEWIMKQRWPFVFRIHEEPAAQSLLKFQQLAATVGVKMDISRGAVNPKILSDLVKRLEGHPAQALLNTALLRSM